MGFKEFKLGETPFSTSQMRVLHLNLEVSGIGRYGLLFGKALGSCRGVEEISVFDEQLFESAFLQDQGGSMSVQTVRWSGDASDKLKALRTLIGTVSHFRPDIIHDSAGSCAKNLAIWPVLAAMAPLVITEHDPVLSQGRHSAMGRAGERSVRWFRRSLMSHIFVHGMRCRQALIDRGVSSSRVSIIRHGHLGIFNRDRYLDVTRNERHVLFFGEVRPNKGVDLLLPVAERVYKHFSDVKFIVAGSSKGRKNRNPCRVEEMHALLREMRKRPYFEVDDRFIPDEEVELFFRRAGITLMPYIQATQSGVAMIAMPLQSAVVATSVGDIPEVVRHGDTGFIAEPDADSVANLLISLFEDTDTVRRVRQSAYDFAMSECDWHTIANLASNKYREILGARMPVKNQRIHAGHFLPSSAVHSDD